MNIQNCVLPFLSPAKWGGVWACKRSPVWFPVASLWASCIDRRPCTTRNDAPFCTSKTNGKRWKRRRRTYRHQSHRFSILPRFARPPFECSSQSRRRPPSGFMRRFSFWWVKTRFGVLCDQFVDAEWNLLGMTWKTTCCFRAPPQILIDF